MTARSAFEGMDVPEVPAGSVGTVVATTLLGRPKVVHFALQTAYGAKQFDVDVHRRNFDLVWATTSTDDAPKHEGHEPGRVRDLSGSGP